MTNNSRQTDPISENTAAAEPGAAAASSPSPEPERLQTAVYIRESTKSVRRMIENRLCKYVKAQPDLDLVSCYAEDCEDVKILQTSGSWESDDTEPGGSREFEAAETGAAGGGALTDVQKSGAEDAAEAESLPEFLRLMSDIRRGEFQCIVVRNLDSFARDFIETAYYIQQVFRYLGVRLIAVEDQFDSDREEDLESLTARTDKAVSDRRSDELSRKRCAVAEKRAKEPDAMPSGSPPYGYLLSTEGGVRKYVPDPEIAPYVRVMFKWAVLGLSSRQIAERMQILGVPTPGQLRLGQTVDPSKWEAHAVLKILENPNYTGDICLLRMKQARYKSQSRRRTSADEWIVRKNTHEPLVTREDFAAVQERLAQNCKRARNVKTS